ncbi:MAG: hypothetical protein IPJ46_22860 [Anaerolineales bacterium]|nr:hypothetical protein [Anaerolineales bacterium]
MTIRVTVPDAYMGDVMSDRSTRRGRVQGTDSERGNTIIVANVPLAEVLRYTTQLRSITGGRGYFTMDFAHYDTVRHITGRSSRSSQERNGSEEGRARRNIAVISN